MCTIFNPTISAMKKLRLLSTLHLTPKWEIDYRPPADNNLIRDLKNVFMNNLLVDITLLTLKIIYTYQTYRYYTQWRSELKSILGFQIKSYKVLFFFLFLVRLVIFAFQSKTDLGEHVIRQYLLVLLNLRFFVMK